MHHNRIHDLAEDLRNHVFELLDAEPSLTGDDAGAVAKAVEDAFTAKLHALVDGDEHEDPGSEPGDVRCGSCGWVDQPDDGTCYNCGASI